MCDCVYRFLRDELGKYCSTPSFGGLYLPIELSSCVRMDHMSGHGSLENACRVHSCFEGTLLDIDIDFGALCRQLKSIFTKGLLPDTRYGSDCSIFS